MSRNFCLLFILLLISWFVLLPKQTYALSLTNASASATTSRPSASSPLISADPLSAGSSQVTVADNLSTFLSSDSAKFFKNGIYSETLTVATTSADRLTVSFTTSTANTQNKTSVLTTPITAMHTIVFTPETTIPSGGKIIITYPTSSSSDTNQSSPSASTWMFNNLTSGDVQLKASLGGATLSGCTFVTTAGSAPSITCTTATAAIPSGATVWLFLGCTAATTSSAGGSCSAQRPLIINPTNTGSRGVASVKNITVQTTDSSSNPLDSVTIKMGTIDSVFVVAHIDPTFSFTINGVAAGTDMHTAQTCGTSYAAISTTNTSNPTANFSSTGTEVNLGTITSSGTNYSAQKMTVSSNTGSGYAITATSSGHLLSPANGSYIVNAQGDVTGNNLPVPAAISTSGTGGFGINACDANSRVNTTFWGQASPLFANPSAQYYYTLVNYPSAPASTGDVVYSVYGARAGGSTPPGDYWEIMTYNASVTF